MSIGVVFDIKRFALHDGSGLRTTLFLKGCPLSCPWCQNPEGISAQAKIWWDAGTCIGCEACLDACRVEGALSRHPGGLHIDPATCTGCGACVDACPSRAMTFTSRKWSLDDVVREALKDRDYFEAFGGGVTVSGGEPLCQYRAVAALFRQLQQEGVHTALDTCGLATREAFTAVLPYADHVLFDVKFTDPGLHLKHTERSNERILENLAAVADYVRTVNCAETTQAQRNIRLWIRTPLIPGATATAENITAVSNYICGHLLDVTERWELCAFNNACKSKYEKLEQPWAYEGTPLLQQSDVDALKEAALASRFPDDRLVVSGLMARDTP